jgi:hypothetical protein
LRFPFTIFPFTLFFKGRGLYIGKYPPPPPNVIQEKKYVKGKRKRGKCKTKWKKGERKRDKGKKEKIRRKRVNKLNAK